VNSTELEESEAPLSGLQLMANLARLFDPVLGAERKIIQILGKEK